MKELEFIVDINFQIPIFTRSQKWYFNS